ncbi:MAG: 3-deoxy-7-phosphoheptulonate synthase [Bacteroidetes bacterium]|nr:MAG: 3-deoxy-7-phosphoheptulonate synthase [Bacteroidota bacterium]
MELKRLIANQPKPFVIAGPCSAESKEQMIATAKEIAEKAAVSVLRAGIWKPRTRPDSFEGIGEEALPWLVEAGKITGLPVTTEVANKDHVEKALSAGVDILWIGARTTVNPFAVQEIADALQGVHIPVMIKNPVNPDLELWIGAFERLEKAGITDLVAIHRGFSFYNHPKYRNVPNWEIPIAFRERNSQIPMICDPSHITGNRGMVAEVAQKALDLNFDGLMIETHLDPDHALSDPAQQVTPNSLKYLLDSLILRTSNVPVNARDFLIEMRDKIEVIDDRIFELLTARMALSEEVGQFKKENKITVLQQEHWAHLIQNRLSKAQDINLTQIFIRQIMDAIHQESIRHQVKIMNK